MAKMSVCDARCQLFHKDMINKENTLRMQWFVKNQQRLIENLKEPKFIKQAEEIIIVSKKREKVSVAEEMKQRKLLPSWIPPVSDGSINIEIMKPIHPDVKILLYEKEIPTFISTNNYLTERYHEPPEKRFYFPECANWSYGWRLGDYLPVPASKIGQKSVMLTEFYHHKIFNLKQDPKWYHGCQIKNTGNFNELLT